MKAERRVTGHDVAVLWSVTELSMREKEITLKEASKKSGEPIKLLVSSLPENSATNRSGSGCPAAW